MKKKILHLYKFIHFFSVSKMLRYRGKKIQQTVKELDSFSINKINKTYVKQTPIGGAGKCVQLFLNILMQKHIELLKN